MMEDTFERVAEVLREKCDLDESIEITMDTTFKEIDLDSLAVVEVALECEEEFGIEIDLEEPPETMREFVEMIEKLLSA